MKALVYRGPGRKAWEDHPDPVVQDPDDAVVRVDAVTICGTDLHILAGDVPTVQAPRVLGHEAVGTVEQVGPGVRNVKAGDRVLVSCITACGRCGFCREGRFGQCLGGGGWILGHLVDGVQAEKVRVPFADLSTYALPHTVTNEAALLMADILPTSYEVGVRAGKVEPGDCVVVVGAGPIGLAAVATARLFSPYPLVVVDPAPARRDAAKLLGADIALAPDEDVVGHVRALTHGLGADVAIEAVGIPETFETCTELVRPGGRVANVGVHGSPATLHLESLWIRDVTVTTGLVDTNTTAPLLRLLSHGYFETGAFFTHRFDLQEMEAAYDVFSRPEDTGALKVALFG